VLRRTNALELLDDELDVRMGRRPRLEEEPHLEVVRSAHRDVERRAVAAEDVRPCLAQRIEEILRRARIVETD
jgi:hypothetical protein